MYIKIAGSIRSGLKIETLRIKIKGVSMALTKEKTVSVVNNFGANERDTGNTKVQIALLTERIKQLTEHCNCLLYTSDAADEL